MADSDKAFDVVLKSEVTLVKCRSCGCDQPVNVAYLPYLEGGTIQDCRFCREKRFVVPGGLG